MTCFPKYLSQVCKENAELERFVLFSAASPKIEAENEGVPHFTIWPLEKSVQIHFD